MYREAFLYRLWQRKTWAFADGFAQDCIDKIGDYCALFLLDIFDSLVDDMIGALFHKKRLVKSNPEEVAYVPFYGFLRIMGEDPIQVTFPTKDTRSYLVNEEPDLVWYGGPGKEPVYGLIEQPALFNLLDDLDGKRPQ